MKDKYYDMYYFSDWREERERERGKIEWIVTIITIILAIVAVPVLFAFIWALSIVF